MAKFLIEVPHGANKKACDEAIEVFLKTGSHFLTHADWGCLDGDHKAWITVDVKDKDEARLILPPIFRAKAKIVQLANFKLQDMKIVRDQHSG
jgi:hypothetical protein